MDLLGHPSIASLRLKSLWDEYEARETAESKFVKDLDLYELCVQAVEYENSAYLTVARAPVEAGAIQLTGPLDQSGQGAKNLQEFFETTLPRILHPVVVGWAQQLYVTPFAVAKPWSGPRANPRCIHALAAWPSDGKNGPNAAGPSTRRCRSEPRPL